MLAVVVVVVMMVMIMMRTQKCIFEEEASGHLLVFMYLKFLDSE
jgi:hypothetical protein